MKILVINGPNINMVGVREKNIYGTKSFEDIIEMIKAFAKEKNVEVKCLQSNHEGTLVDWIQSAYFEKYDGVMINPGAYTHTSIAILDAIKAIAPIPVIEVHLSDIHSREDFRNVSYLSQACIDQVYGQGDQSYIIAFEKLLNYINK